MADTLVTPGRAQAAGAASARWLMPLLVGLFFLSGLAGLVYQVLWLRLLALVFGVTVWAASTVLAAFMAGLALGSLAAGWLVDRAGRPLLWYGVAEVLVGLLALATPPALRGVERLYVGLHPLLPESLELVTLLRFALSFGVLLAPTTLMGATLPIVVKSSLLRTQGLGERIGVLYATNTAGAVAGTLLAGFYLIGGLGVGAAFGVAAAVNVAVGLAAILAARRLGSSGGGMRGQQGEAATGQRQEGAARGGEAASVPRADRGAVRPSLEPALSARARGMVLAVFGLSGFASLALEVVWFRVLVQFYQATTYAFTLMLAAVLFGIAAGSSLATPLMRRRVDWLVVLAALELAIGVAAVLSLAVLAWTSGAVSWTLGEAGAGFPRAAHLLPVALASFAALFPTTLLLGLAFPIGLRLWAAGADEQAERVGSRIGAFYALNVCGGIFGSLAAGFLLVPWLGSRVSLIGVAALSLLAGVLLAWVASERRRATALALAGLAAFGAATLAVPDPLVAALERRHPGEQLLWREEGAQATVTVHHRPGSGRTLYVDGLHQSDEHPGTVLNHRMIGHLPMLLHPDPRDVLVVGLGAGTTAGAASTYPSAMVEVVELSGGVARAAEWFRESTYDVLRRPNVRLRVDDGRNYLLLTARRYDVITADIILPFHAGAGNLYSAEYFRLARNALKEGGVMVQWAGGVPEVHQKLIMRTFLSVFPETTLWFDGHLMVGATRPLELDRRAFERKLEPPGVREALAAVGIGDFGSLLALRRANAQELREYVGPGPILTDDRPLVEYFLSFRAGQD